MKTAPLFFFTQRDLNQMNDELTLLKQRADQMGITYHPNIGIETLRERVSGKLADTPGQDDDQSDDAEADQNTNQVSAASGKKLTHKEEEQVIREKQWAEQLKLVRIRVACLNPNKKDLKGEIFTVANKYLGTIRKFVPFGEDSDYGYHVPFVIYNMMKDRKFIATSRKRDSQGREQVTQRQVPEFSIEMMEPLSPVELEQLGRQQQAAQGL